ncbi:TIGR03086 family metal-binding protein [Streptomyces sp. SID13031]|uniref:TIGR03086 family metal-binding protein n=1 Tax=Streptomyces sp. SID13031 TaxID=2706046 RepID=UPI0013CBBE5F|nr:TIGR03086 family metal-binding protein [Streptomyces sp. SID13031]NEA34152.1 TIGR03086 family protein [Streptomyces sp. SID13031]
MDVVELHRRTSEEFARQVAAVGPAQWGDPTPCPDWDVRTLVNHVVGEERWTVPLLAGRTIEEVGDSLDGDLLGNDPASAATEAARAAQLAITEPVLRDATVQLSYGEESAAEYVSQLAADHLVHGWDLAVAIGADARLDPEVVAAVASWFKDREELYRGGGAIGPRVEGFSSATDSLLGAFGRDPAWTPGHTAVALLGDAFGIGDVDAIMAQLTADCVFESTSPAPDGSRFVGAEAVREQWRKLFAETPEPLFETEESVVLGDRAVVRWRFSWAEADGGRGHVRGVDVLRLRDGKIAEKLSYVKG